MQEEIVEVQEIVLIKHSLLVRTDNIFSFIFFYHAMCPTSSKNKNSVSLPGQPKFGPARNLVLPEIP